MFLVNIYLHLLLFRIFTDAFSLSPLFFLFVLRSFFSCSPFRFLPRFIEEDSFVSRNRSSEELRLEEPPKPGNREIGIGKSSSMIV